MTSATITVTGNLGGDAESKFLPSGAHVLNFSLAHTPRRKNQQTGEWEDAGETQWYRCSLWGQAAELYAEVLRKGQVGAVTVTGAFTPRTFEGKNGTQTSLDVNVDAIGVREPRSTRPQQPATGDAWGGAGNDNPPF